MCNRNFRVGKTCNVGSHCDKLLSIYCAGRLVRKTDAATAWCASGALWRIICRPTDASTRACSHSLLPLSIEKKTACHLNLPILTSPRYSAATGTMTTATTTTTTATSYSNLLHTPTFSRISSGGYSRRGTRPPPIPRFFA